MFSQIQLIGNVGRDPELNVTQDGTPVCKFTLAVNRPRKKGQDKEETIWYNVSAWRALAETIDRYVVKGTTLFVQGDLYPRKYTAKDGTPGFSLDVTLEKFSFAGGKSANDSARSTADTGDKDPFLPDFPE